MARNREATIRDIFTAAVKIDLFFMVWHLLLMGLRGDKIAGGGLFHFILGACDGFVKA